MVELLQTFSRVVVAFLSGAMLIAGTIFWVDVFRGFDVESPFDQIAEMHANTFADIFTVITALTAYAIGIINFAGSSVAFRYLANVTERELLILSRIESLQQPQLLKEMLELMQLKRALVAFAIPLAYLGAALACDFHEQSFSNEVRIFAGAILTGLACVAYFFAARLTRLVDAAAKKILDEPLNNRLNPPGSQPAS